MTGVEEEDGCYARTECARKQRCHQSKQDSAPIALSAAIGSTSERIRGSKSPRNMAFQRKAVAYMRMSSSENVGADKDSETRQWRTISEHAKRCGFLVVKSIYDAAVCRAGPVESRLGFQKLIEYAVEHNISHVLVEDASRFARDLVVQEVAYQSLTHNGFKIIAASHPDQFTAEGPTATLVRQLLGAVSQFDKSRRAS
eukprot:6471683-Amphidinium_carterae.1